MSHVFVRTGIEFEDCQQALAHIGEEMLKKVSSTPPIQRHSRKGR